MPEISVYLANKLLDHVLNNTAYTPPATVYLALFDGDPEAAGAEKSGGGYVRKSLTWASPAARSTTTTALVTFTNMPGGAITHAALYDALTGGNRLFSSPLDSTVNLAAGDNYNFDPGTIIAGLNL